MLIHAAEELAATHGVAAACAALAVPRSSFYRVRVAAPGAAPLPPECERDMRPTHPRALRPTERTQVRDLLNSEQFQDLRHAKLCRVAGCGALSVFHSYHVPHPGRA